MDVDVEEDVVEDDTEEERAHIEQLKQDVLMATESLRYLNDKCEAPS
jgi:hypothetical protein